MLGALSPLALVAIAVGPYLDAIAVLHVVLPLTLVPIIVPPRLTSIMKSGVKNRTEQSITRGRVLTYLASVAVQVTVLPAALVAITVGPYVNTLAMLCSLPPLPCRSESDSSRVVLRHRP